MPDTRSYGPIEVGHIESALMGVLRGAGAAPSLTGLGFLRDYIRLGMHHGFSVHEIVAFIARGWPRYRPKNEGEGVHPVAAAMFGAAMLAVNQGQARSTAVLEAWAGYDMAHVALRCGALYKRDG